jgi:hypothetical protein
MLREHVKNSFATLKKMYLITKLGQAQGLTSIAAKNNKEA